MADATHGYPVRTVLPQYLAAACASLVADGSRLLTFFGTDERATAGVFGLYAAFLNADGGTDVLRADVDASRPSYPSVTRDLPAVHWDERELRDLLGVVPEEHPDPRPLVLREDWPAGLYPLRKDFDPAAVPPPARAPETFDPRPVEGEGVVSVPVGPIHAGIIEPGHFRFAALGEVVLQLEARLFYTHRGLEKLAEGKTPDQALPLAERICGACAFSHAVAFCEAVEGLAGCQPPPRAVWGRTLLLELERLYNHLGDAGNVCAGTGFAVGAMQGALLKERVQQLIERLVGNRFLRGACAVGGLRRDFETGALSAARRELAELHDHARKYSHLLVETDSFVERLRGTGCLDPGAVRALGGVGVAARASGVDTDLRRDRPYAGYADLRHDGTYPGRADLRPDRQAASPAQRLSDRPHAAHSGLRALHVPLHTTGDVEARLRQRLAEATVSFHLADELLAEPPSGPVRLPVGPPAPGRLGLGAIESPRGANVHTVLFDQDGRVSRYHVRSAPFPNWPLVALSVPGNLMPDYPLINKSFELCYACLDR